MCKKNCGIYNTYTLKTKKYKMRYNNRRKVYLKTVGKMKEGGPL